MTPANWVAGPPNHGDGLNLDGATQMYNPFETISLPISGSAAMGSEDLHSRA